MAKGKKKSQAKSPANVGQKCVDDRPKDCNECGDTLLEGQTDPSCVEATVKKVWYIFVNLT